MKINPANISNLTIFCFHFFSLVKMTKLLNSNNRLVFGAKRCYQYVNRPTSCCSGVSYSPRRHQTLPHCHPPVLSSLLKVRYLSQEVEKTTTPRNTEWEILYKFHTIKYIRLISRFKVYQIFLMTGLCYPLYLQYAEGAISGGLFYSALGGCIGTSVVFIVFSYFATKVIGQLAVNKQLSKVRVSRLNFYGSRCEDFISREAIIPWSDVSTPEDLSKMFQRLDVEKESKERVYLYTLKYGRVSDTTKFEQILGVPCSASER